MLAMETVTLPSSTTTTTENKSVDYGKLPPLNPDDLKLPPPPPSAAEHVTNQNDSISISEVFAEMKAKLKEGIIGSSVSGILSVMRGTNFAFAFLMVLISVFQIAKEADFWSAIQDIFAVFYTIMFSMILVAYELRTKAMDDILRDSYGFMYSPKGRCLFLAMISIFPFGMQGFYGILVSLIGFCNAYFNYYVITQHPSFSRGIPDYIPPDVKSSTKNSDEACV